MANDLESPYPWFGGKRRAAALVWERLGDVDVYIEPFFGSGAVFLQAPWPSKRLESINDINAFIANFWRAIKADPDRLAEAVDAPKNETEIRAWQLWLIDQAKDGKLADKLVADPEWYDLKIAAKWCWGLCCFLGSGWCRGDQLNKIPNIGNVGVLKKTTASPTFVGIWNVGVLKKTTASPTFVRSGNVGVLKKTTASPTFVRSGNVGVLKKTTASPTFVKSTHQQGVLEWFLRLAERLRRVRVCCGGWERMLSPAVSTYHGVCGVFLDPPYAEKEDVYSDREPVSKAVGDWCLKNGENHKYRIALCGYSGEHDRLEEAGWDVVAWAATGGMSKNKKEGADRFRERVWFSPHCVTRRVGLEL